MNILEALDHVRHELQSVGIRAEADPRDVNPPGAWITFESVEHGTVVCGGSVVRVHVYLIVPDTGVAQTTTQLSDMLTDLLRVIDPDEPTTKTSVQLPGAGAAGLPSLRVALDVQTD